MRNTLVLCGNYILEYFLKKVKYRILCETQTKNTKGGENLILENIERLCKENRISISRLEKSCGFGNGTIRGWKNSDPAVGKVKKVADHFGITVNDLIIPQTQTNKQDSE